MKQYGESKKFGLVFLMGMLIFALAGYTKSDASQLEGYPIDTNVLTTLQRTVVPIPVPSGSSNLYPYQVSSYNEYGYGKWQYGPGTNCEKRLDIMATNYSGASVANTARLLKFFTISDVHIVDEESPVQVMFAGYKGGPASPDTISAYSSTMLYTTHVLDAAIQTVNALHRQSPFDFGLALGDACNNTQLNELRWYIDVLDGQDINPDSGIKDDPVPGPYNDYQDEYKAAGLDPAIPWYQVLGNHDHFCVLGIPVVNDYVRPFFIGEDILNVGEYPVTNLNDRGFYVGAINGTTFYGDLIGVGPTNDFLEPPKVLAADPNRRSLSRNEWISEFFNTTSLPIGHGFSQTNVTTGFACYTFEPKPNLPLKVIVLDDTQSETDPNVGSYAHTSLDTNRYAWLVSELDKGQAEGKLMIIAAHCPIGMMTGLWNPAAPISETNLIAKLNTYPNLILWATGHLHVNQVIPLPSPDSAHPELGFWEVATASLKDFPQQFRTFEIVFNSDATLSIIAIDVDPSVTPGSLAAISRSYAVASEQIFCVPIAYEPVGSYNAELVKQLTPAMQVKLRGISRQTQNDYDGDGKADPAVFDSASGVFTVFLSGSSYVSSSVIMNVQPSAVGLQPIPGDYDGDGKADPAVFDPIANQLLVRFSSQSYNLFTMPIGNSSCAPVCGDFDGDRKADPALYSATSGLLTAWLSGSGYSALIVQLGGAGWLNASDDYDGDGKTDPAVFENGDPSTGSGQGGTWQVLLSGTAYAPFSLVTAGGVGVVPVPGDYDGDGQADPTTFQPATGLWLSALSSQGYLQIMFGGFAGSTYLARSGDYDGDGKTDPAVYAPSLNAYCVWMSGSGYNPAVLSW